ncbi:sigma-70 family RNA polymerase sigma factor [Rummeliibacillus pycnus]|uniref:sigma-70 family RNA polymerase sigma factor n=1 Tax=Rummeliibacillus pycnus TaxID=101070 RepID=UPI0037C903D4
MKITEQNVVQQLKKQNELALNYIIAQYGGMIKCIISEKLSRKQDIEECVDDVFLGIWQNIDHFDSSKSSLKNWIATISKYKMIDRLRKHIKEIERQSLVEEIPELSQIQRDLSAEVHNLLSYLSDEDQAIFKKYYLEEKGTNEIVQELQLEKSFIYNRLSRGRKKLKGLKNKIFGEGL